MTLETIWFLLWGVLWAIYFVLDGFDLGMGTLLPFIAKNETEKRTIYNAAGPFWDGNEVWLITAGGVTFAAFPAAYAALFSGMYTALFLLLFALILRGVSFEFRSKVDNDSWRKVWDTCHFLGSFLPALLLGVAFANIFRGIPLDAQGVNQEGLLQLLNPYGLFGGVLFVVMFTMHGAIWLAIKSGGDLHERAKAVAIKTWPVAVVGTVLFLAYTSIETMLFNNYMKNPLLFLVLLGAVLGLISVRPALGSGKMWRAWTSSAVFIAGVTLFGVIGLFPALLPSNLNPAWSMTIYNSASSPLTLKIMLGVALVMVPIVLAYQAWVYRTFSHKITQEDLDYKEAY
ncbi:cytochrome d ubiquinol oxidase subunit II [Desulfovibrio ferrophilus]|uniref:Cytochrome d ubiquinol oxidase subunit II n=1 Tax=Desulfovibrio ferrophilus TaxID=241368 RepID=A0A2Z6B2G4_9BACT|nr:cytochrome d ubiquinol oxidase subunit II [Desulfovibrio ferrophilus]BBD09643.1 cytochrome d ubiquinol oxidase subunit II [Desulfovibrio ferrophilus]